MQTVPPVFVAAAPLVERPQAVLAVQGPAETGSSGTNGETDNPDARDTALASDRAREVARLMRGRAEEEPLIPGFPPLDTREVGDQDIIDPNRPAVRGPEPLADAALSDALPPLPDEIDPTGAETADQVEFEFGGPPAFGASGTAEDDGERETPEAQTDDPPVPVIAAQPASPGASAPDVPEPPAPGTVDIRR